MGINNKHIWAVAMGVSLLLVAVGGVLMGIRTNFEPLIGSQRLIFAFEAASSVAWAPAGGYWDENPLDGGTGCP